MKFWDSSALAPLTVEEPASRAMRALYDRDPAIIVWWGALVECASAAARLAREGALPAGGWKDAARRLAALRESWQEVQPIEELRETAMRFLRVHSLRASDSLQLAAAFHAAELRPAGLEFVCLDHRLREAADREGFPLLPA